MMRMRQWIQDNPNQVSKLKVDNLLGYTPICNITGRETTIAVCAQLQKYLTDLVNWFKVAGKITTDEISELAELMYEQYGDLSMPDFFLFCRYAKTGSMTVDGQTCKFELPYNRLDGQVLCQWLTIYREAKNEARERSHRLTKQQPAAAWEWTPEQSAAFDEYMKQLRDDMAAQKPEPDYDAIARERSARREQMIAIAMNDLHGATLDELTNLIPQVAGDLILTEAVNRMISARKGVGE